LVWFYPSTTAQVNLNIKGQFLKSTKAYIVYFTFGGTILLWLFDFLHGMNAYVVGLIPVGVFLATNIITKEDLKKLSWDVLWLVSGGIALGLALDKTGLAANLINDIAFDELSPYLIVVAATVLSTLMANFMSNTATANLLLPIIAALGTALPALEGLGGSKMLILSVAMAASLGMALPISTPPNALAHATGLIKTEDMTKVGVIIGLVGLIAIYALMFVLKITNFF
jgi:sodium-dependent dicarboxylate transporter 2/3/5